jgi:hypothetical protein
VIAPPSTGPIATPLPVIAPKSPSATPRSRPGNACASSASDVANMIAPPTPWAPREISRKSGPVATPQKSDPVVKATIPMAKSSRRPYRSASEPAVSRNEAKVKA